VAGADPGVDLTRAVIGALLVVALAVGGPISDAAPASPEMSDDVRRRLTAGEVVVRDTMPPGASTSARGGTALALVRAAPEQVWRVLTDYRGHSRFYPRVTAAELLEGDDRHVLVRYEVGVGPISFAFHMDKYPDARRRRIEWHLANGHSHGLFRENSGYWQVDPTDGASLVTYAIAVRTVIPAFLTLGRERDSLTETVTAMRKLVEEGGGVVGSDRGAEKSQPR
jgi:ribosome-associated toxin RatA of RatAB toxin-antitoxin module